MPGLIVNNVTYLDPEFGEFLPNTSVRVENDRFVEVNDADFALLKGYIGGQLEADRVEVVAA